MKKIHLLGFLLLLVSTLSMLQGSTFAQGENDNDNDGIPNNSDQCPFLKEDYNPEYGNNIDGCPADFVPWYDADYDGIEDHVDDCPSVKETYNRFEDNDGCPAVTPTGGEGIKDSDNDGFTDLVDLCPTSPETFNGIDDKDGCPDDFFVLRDSDKDGISDKLDECPNPQKIIIDLKMETVVLMFYWKMVKDTPSQIQMAMESKIDGILVLMSQRILTAY